MMKRTRDFLKMGPMGSKGATGIEGCICGEFPKLGIPFWGSHNKGYNILGSILGSPPILGNYHMHAAVI